jgi:HSP20 family protein
MKDKENKDTVIEKTGAPGGLGPLTFVEAEDMLGKLAEVSREIENLAFDFFRARGGGIGKDLDDWFRAERQILLPVPIQVTESDEKIHVSAAVPGFKPDEIQVSIKDKMLVICGEKEEKNEKDKLVHEWKSDRFCRQLILPSDVIADKVEAELADGMLELTLPKLAEEPATKVAVKTA